MVEHWQCDADGRYRHHLDTGGRHPDPCFQGHAHTLADAGGCYRFRTIRAAAYTGRTPPMHAAVFPPGADPLTYQRNVASEPGNADDFICRCVPAELRHLVTGEFAAGGAQGAKLALNYDIVRETLLHRAEGVLRGN